MANLPDKITNDIPFLPLFVDELVETQQDLLQQQNRLNRYSKRAAIATGLSIQLIGQLPFGLYFQIIGLVSILFFIWRWNRIKRKNKKIYQALYQKNINGFITESLEIDWKYLNKPIPFDDTDKMAAIIFEGNVQLTDLNYNVSGSFANHSILIRKFSAKLRESRIKSQFNGLLLTIELSQAVDYKTIITPRNSYQNPSELGTNTLALHQLNFNIHNDVDASFTRYFKVYSTKNGTHPDFFTLSLQRQLAHFITNYKVHLHLYFYHERMYATIRTNKIIDPPALNKPEEIEPRAVAYYDELKIAAEFLKRLEIGGLFHDELVIISD